jgi:hypothetical protein
MSNDPHERNIWVISDRNELSCLIHAIKMRSKTPTRGRIRELVNNSSFPFLKKIKANKKRALIIPIKKSGLTMPLPTILVLILKINPPSVQFTPILERGL